MTPVNSEIRRAVTQLTYSPQQYTPIAYEEDPDTSTHEIRGWKRTTGVTYVGIVRDTHELKMRIRFRFRFRSMQMSWSCQSTKLWPNVQDADDVISSNEYALILR
jgi:hypothetical protein